MHAIVDGKARNIRLMTHKQEMADYMRALAQAIGMSVFQEPVVVGYPWPGSKDTDALSAVCFLKESAIVVHTYPEQEFVFVDIFSCRDFDAIKACRHVERAFDIALSNLVILDRGIDPITGKCKPACFVRG